MDEHAPWRTLEDAPGPRSGESATHNTPPRWWLGGAFAVAAILLGAAVWLVVSGGQGLVGVEGSGPGQAANLLERGLETPSGSPKSELVIDIQGAVVRPGIVRLSAGARVADAIAAAGGYGPRVAVERVAKVLNLAAQLHDGDQVVVPSRDDPMAASSAPDAGSGGAGGTTGGPVDLNRASATALDTLPGIGPVTAAKIIAAREEQPFASLDDLRTRKVLGAAAIEKIKDLVVVR